MNFAKLSWLFFFTFRNGDLCKLCTSKNSRARVTSIKKWEELAVLLNSDGAGVTKTTEKWKKVSHVYCSSPLVKTGCGDGIKVFASLSDLRFGVTSKITRKKRPHGCIDLLLVLVVGLQYMPSCQI